MRRFPLLIVALLACASPVFALNLSHKSVSLSRQFIVYCDDMGAGEKIASFADDTKKNFCALLGQPDKWKRPIVIQVVPEDPANPSAIPARTQLCETEDGGKVEIDVTLGSDPREVHFEQQIVRGLLLEFAYRNQPIQSGVAYAEPPPWLVEGAVAYFHNRDSNFDPGVFKRLMTNDHLPRLADFLSQSSANLDRASRQFYSACAMSLVQLLVELPGGRASLTAFVKNFPRDSSDNIGALIKNFPTLGATTESMEKWWALSMARLAASDRYQGLSLQDSEQRLAAILSFEIPVGRAGEKKTFTLDQFEEFKKLPGSRAVLTRLTADLLALSTQVSMLYRPVISDYQQVAAELARGKTRGAKDHLAAAAKYREVLLTRIDQIEDYLNWFEATQMSTESDSFDDYMKTAKALAHDASKRDDPISRYLDVVQQQTQ